MHLLKRTQKLSGGRTDAADTPEGLRNVTSILNRILEAARDLPVWLRFIIVFAVLLVVVVLSGRAVQPGLVPLLYVLLIVGAAGYLLLELHRGRQEHQTNGKRVRYDCEDEWLDEVIRRLTDCQKAIVYLRYFRDPDTEQDKRLDSKRGKVKKLMTRFSQLLVNHEDGFFLVGFRKQEWTDDPKEWLVRHMREIRRDIPEVQARNVVEAHVLVIYNEPHPNSSTVYLIDDRYLLFNRVVGGIGFEEKEYHAQYCENSIIPSLIKNGFHTLFKHTQQQ